MNTQSLKGALIVILVGLTVLVSGCTLPGQETRTQPQGVEQSSTEGVIIQSFGPRDSVLMSGDTTKFDITVKNVGGDKATNVKIYAPYIEGLSGKSETCGDLNPPLPEKNKEGEICTATWDYTAPSVQSTRTYSPSELVAYVTFNYTTKAQFAIPIYTTNKVNELRRAGKLPTAKPLTSNTNGPIKFEYDGPVYLEVDPSKTSQTFSDLKLIVRNVGSGNPPADEYGKKRIPKITMKSSVDFVNITGECVDSSITLDYRYCTFNVEVKDVSKIKNTPTKGIDVVVDIISNYSYTVSKGTSLEIQPK